MSTKQKQCENVIYWETILTQGTLGNNTYLGVYGGETHKNTGKEHVMVKRRRRLMSTKKKQCENVIYWETILTYR